MFLLDVKGNEPDSLVALVGSTLPGKEQRGVYTALLIAKGHPVPGVGVYRKALSRRIRRAQLAHYNFQFGKTRSAQSHGPILFHPACMFFPVCQAWSFAHLGNLRLMT